MIRTRGTAPIHPSPASTSTASPFPASTSPSTARVLLCLLLAVLCVSARAAAQTPAAQTPPAAPPAQAPSAADTTLRIFLAGRPIGTETYRVTRHADGWTIASTGQMGAASTGFQLKRGEIQYDTNWAPRKAIVDASMKGGTVSFETTVDGTTARSQIVQNEQTSSKADSISRDALLLPNNVYAAYEAVVTRLASLKPKDTFKTYVAPQAEVTVSLDAVVTERVETPGRAFESTHYTLTVQNIGAQVTMEVWADDRQRLMRLKVPASQLEVVRDDIASVSTRETSGARDTDENVTILANGFNLAATISRPSPLPPPVNKKPARLPAAIIVPGSGPVGRDGTVAGIPVYAQLAGALADAGYLVVRYDKRGLGQSGGRTEAVTLPDYAEDVRAIVRYLDKRKDVDKDRIAVVGHSEGAAVGLIAARHEKKIRALVLAAGPGMLGADIILAQQRHLLDRMTLPDAEKQAKIDLQKKIQQAVMTGQGLDALPADMRRQADTPLFRSMLLFDPAGVMPKVRQPILIVQGELDVQIPPVNADRLQTLAKARKNDPGVELVRLPGVNHLLVPAKTGEVEEYASLPARAISLDASGRIVDWLARVMTPKK